MLVTNHVLSGALIGLAAPGLASSFAVSVVSHLALDAVPHWGEESIEDVMHIAVADGLLGLTAMALTTATAPPGRRWRVLAGTAGAAFLDLDKPSKVFFGFSPFPRLVDRVHAAVQRESAHRMPQEIVVGLGSLAAYLLLARRGFEGRLPG